MQLKILNPRRPAARKRSKRSFGFSKSYLPVVSRSRRSASPRASRADFYKWAIDHKKLSKKRGFGVKRRSVKKNAYKSRFSSYKTPSINNCGRFGIKLAPAKARLMLHDKQVRGRPLTTTQRKLFG